MRQATRYLIATGWVLSALVVSDASAIARPIAPLSRFTPAQIQRLSRDLNRSNAEDFFRQGQEKLEREVQLLNRKRNLLTDELLKVDPPIQMQRDPSSSERSERPRDRSILD